MGLKNSILKIFSVNVLSMLSGIIISFIVPAILSIEGYSELKTFNFYLTYTAFLSLGFVDGMYIKYGGKLKSNVNKEEFKLEHTVFLAIQIVLSIIIAVIGIFQKNTILILVALSIVPSAIFGFFTMFYQSVGEFSKYTKIMAISTICTLVLNLLLAIVFRSKNYLLYCFIPIITNTILFVYLEYKFWKNFKFIKIKYDKKVWKNIKIGFFILLGNLSVILFYGIDRWFIKIFYTSSDFAYYSFAVSMLNLINILINAISVTLYNHISKKEDENEIYKMKKILVLIGSVASLSYFIFAGIVNMFLKKYIQALDVISISFAAYPYMIVINTIFVNLYKSRKQEKKYFNVVLKMLIISVVYNLIAIIFSNNIRTIAIATTIAFITWYIISMLDFGYLKSDKKEITFLIINTTSFIIISNYFNWIIGGILYLIILIITIMLLFKEVLIDMINTIKNK